MKKIILLIKLTILFSYCKIDKTNNGPLLGLDYINKNEIPMLKEYDTYGGMVLSDRKYGISIFRKNDEYLILGEEFLGHNNFGQARYKIINYLIFNEPDSFHKTALDSDLIAILKRDGDTIKIVRLWQVRITNSNLSFNSLEPGKAEYQEDYHYENLQLKE